MRISDWSSDVCSSDLAQAVIIAVDPLHHLFTLRYPITVSILCNGAIFRYVMSEARAPQHFHFQRDKAFFQRLHPCVGKGRIPPPKGIYERERAQSRERVSKYVLIWVVTDSCKQKKTTESHHNHKNI